MKVGLGGTFNVIHKGHELLFETAFTVGDSVEVGLTSDEFARRSKKVQVVPYAVRKQNLEKFLGRYGKPFEVVKIDDLLGSAARSEDLDAIVVSPETKENADRINAVRASAGLKPLKVLTIRTVRAEDSGTISSSRIVTGEIDREGHLLRPLKVAVGSTNNVKVDAVRNIFSRAYGLVEVVGVDTGQPKDLEPLEGKTVEGAVDRARKALAAAKADFGVGIEAGIFLNKHLGKHLDVQYCAIVDSHGNMTVGHGPGFEYPPEVTAAALKGIPVGETMGRLTGIEDIGRRAGSIGYLSDGMMDRTSLTEIAVLMALIPRMRSELYS